MSDFANLYKQLLNLERRVRTLEAINQQKVITFTEAWLHMADYFYWGDRLTSSATYSNVVGSNGNAIDFDDWPNHGWYFEITAFTDDGAGYWKMYNDTLTADVAGSELSTTENSETRLRTSSLTKPSSLNEFRLKHKRVGGAGNANLISARTVFRID